MTRTSAPVPIEPEIWRPVVGNDSYEVSNLGNVRRTFGGLLKPWRGFGGKPTVTLSDRGRPTTKRVEELVAEAFPATTEARA